MTTCSSATAPSCTAAGSATPASSATTRPCSTVPCSVTTPSSRPAPCCSAALWCRRSRSSAECRRRYGPSPRASWPACGRSSHATPATGRCCGNTGPPASDRSTAGTDHSAPAGAVTAPARPVTHPTAAPGAVQRRRAATRRVLSGG